MTEEEWFQFVASGKPPIVSVTRLPEDLCKIIGASNTLIRMQHVYALKMAHKHDLKPEHLPMLPITIECGLAIRDRPGHLCFYYFEDVVFGSWFQATVKRTQDGTELWVATFHRANAKEVARTAKKHGAVRALIR